MTNTMNITNLRTFVEALNNLPDDVKNNQQSIYHSVGCRSGLVIIVAEDIPELKSLYPKHTPCFYEMWQSTLEVFLGFDERGLRKWAENNPELWGDEYSVFNKGAEFGQKTDIFPHSAVIRHWTKLLEMVEQQQKELTK